MGCVQGSSAERYSPCRLQPSSVLPARPRLFIWGPLTASQPSQPCATPARGPGLCGVDRDAQSAQTRPCAGDVSLLLLVRGGVLPALESSGLFLLRKPQSPLKISLNPALRAQEVLER